MGNVEQEAAWWVKEWALVTGAPVLSVGFVLVTVAVVWVVVHFVYRERIDTLKEQVQLAKDQKPTARDPDYVTAKQLGFDDTGARSMFLTITGNGHYEVAGDPTVLPIRSENRIDGVTNTAATIYNFEEMMIKAANKLHKDGLLGPVTHMSKGKFRLIPSERALRVRRFHDQLLKDGDIPPPRQ